MQHILIGLANVIVVAGEDSKYPCTNHAINNEDYLKNVGT